MSGPRPSPFRLTKWYLDCVASDGRVAIAYHASLFWRGARVSWHAVTVFEPGQPPRQRTSLAASAPPESSGAGVIWNAPHLGCRYHAESRAHAVVATLLETDLGRVEWDCTAPTTRVSLALSTAPPVVGTGYVERLSMTLVPWRLPIDELRWGRWISEDAARSVVWIDWRGTTPRRWVYHDGCVATQSSVSDASVVAEGAHLTLADTRTLGSDALQRAFNVIPPLRRAVPASLRRWRDTKECSTGVLNMPGTAPVYGRAIHERVVMR